MKSRYKYIIINVSCFFAVACAFAQQEAFRKINPVAEQLQLLPITEISPEGWLKQRLQQDLRGFVGHLDQLAPDLIGKDDIYGKDRLTRDVKKKDVGALSTGAEWEVQYLWWNSETQGNWWDGFIRTAILTKDPAALAKAQQHVDAILRTQDADGYLGIYDRDLRYHFDRENGELWSKTTLLRGLLAWYQYKNSPQLLNAIERAVQNVMDHYSDTAHPFFSVQPNVGGLSHGLAFTDVLESLYRITHKQVYMDYCLFLYMDFSRQVLNEDAQYAKLLQKNLPLKGHGVHTYEHLRSVAAAYYASGNPALRTALYDFLEKIGKETLPSGAAAGDEWIGGRMGDATKTGYEYCSLQELMNGYADLLVKTGSAAFAEHAERLFLNAAQGARDPSESAIAYLKTDNSFCMTGGQNFDTANKQQTRYKYSPVHQDVAVCCVPNAGRITPYYIEHLWLKDKDGLVAALFGPSSVHTSIKGQPVTVKETMTDPMHVSFSLQVQRPQSFTFRVRKPVWATAVRCNIPYREENGYIVFANKWPATTRIDLNFVTAPEVHKDAQAAYYVTYGPWVLAHAWPATATQTRSFPLKGFHDWQYRPVSPIIYRYNGIAQPKLIASSTGLVEWVLTDPNSGKSVPVRLQPMGTTVLRQVSFNQD